MTLPVVLVALDVSNADQARAIVEALHQKDLPFGVKIGMELACAAGQDLIREMVGEDLFVFDDQKRCDIPTTIEKTMWLQLQNGAQMANCMAHCGPAGLAAFQQVCSQCFSLSIAVTVLTTKDDAECQKEFGRSARDQVTFYADWAKEAALDGIVCSPHEIAIAKERGLLAVTPGVRPAFASANDQKRIMTPAEAVRSGADFLVIGRPVTSREYGQPAENLARILDEIHSVS